MLLFLIPLLAGCNGEQPGTVPVSPTRIKVTVARVEAAESLQGLTYSGTIEASQTIPLTFQTTGIVKEVLADAGDAVRKGQLLATVDDADLQNIYSTALVRFNQAQDAYDRLKQVHDQGSLPDIKWVEMQSNLGQARAALDLAKNNLGKCRMLAPVDGIVGRRNIEPGQSAISLVNAPFELVRIEKVEVRIAVPENEINRIAKGAPARISVPAAGQALVEGSVSTVSPVAEAMSRTYTVKVSVDNPRRDLKPGMVCDVSVGSARPGKSLVVPNTAVTRDHAGNTMVFRVNPGTGSVSRKIVRVGRCLGPGIEILAGLAEGDTVVSRGIEKLSDNSLIER